MLEKQHVNLKQTLTMVVLVMFVFCTVAYVVPTVKATVSLSLTPNSGPAGTEVTYLGTGFVAHANIYINGVFFTTVQAQTGTISGQLQIPANAPVGTVTIHAVDAVPQAVDAIFQVTSSSSSSSTTSSSPAPSSTPVETPSSPQLTTYTYPTLVPTQTPIVQSSGFWSPTVVAVVGVVVALAIIIPLGFFFTRGPKRERLLEREPLPIQPVQPPPAYAPPTSRYGQSTSSYQPRYSSYMSRYSSSAQTSRPTMTSRYGQSTAPSIQQPTAVGKTCPHCHRAIRGDYNICPYCYKKIK